MEGGEAAQLRVSGAPRRRGNPCSGPGECARAWAACPFLPREILVYPARLEENVIKLWLIILNHCLQRGRQGAWKGKQVVFQDTACLLILQLPLSPSPFLPFCLPLLASPSFLPGFCSLPLTSFLGRLKGVECTVGIS